MNRVGERLPVAELIEESSAKPARNRRGELCGKATRISPGRTTKTQGKCSLRLFPDICRDPFVVWPLWSVDIGFAKRLRRPKCAGDNSCSIFRNYIANYSNN